MTWKSLVHQVEPSASEEPALAGALKQAFPLPSSGRFSELLSAIDAAAANGPSPSKSAR